MDDNLRKKFQEVEDQLRKDVEGILKSVVEKFGCEAVAISIFGIGGTGLGVCASATHAENPKIQEAISKINLAVEAYKASGGQHPSDN